MIIDNHMHIFPYLGGASGFDSLATHMKHLQLMMCGYASPHRRTSDQVIVRGTLWDDKRPAICEALYDVDFRVGRYGRCEWTKDGVDYYNQKFAPSLQDMEAPAEHAIAQMDYVGVDMAVLHNQNFYGFLNDYIGDAVKRYPDRFIGLAQVHEEESHKHEQVDLLIRTVENHGMRGLYFAPAKYEVNPDYLNDRKYQAFWDTVRDLRLVAYLSVDWRDIPKWAERYPDVKVITGLPHTDASREGKITFAEDVIRFMSLPEVAVEICPIGYGARYEYPYTEIHATIRPFYEEFGGSKLVWGADMPNLERWCTYLQGLDFLRRHCSFIDKDDMRLILGGNLMRIYGLHEAST